MEQEQKKEIKIISISAIFLIIAIFIEEKYNFSIWINFIFYIVPYLICGLKVLKEAGEKIIRGDFLDEDFLMSIATIGALSIGFLDPTKAQFREAVLVMLLFKIGELFEDIAEGKSKKSISNLIEIKPEYANIEKGKKIVKVAPQDVKVNDIVIIKPGEKIPVDGIITEGNGSLNTVTLTGESIPYDVKLNDEVKSGCINLTSVIKIKATKSYEDSTVSKIIELIENASNNKSKSEKFITKFSKYYTPIVLALSILLAIVPSILYGNYNEWIIRALTFLVVSCPCALVISVPLAFFGGVGGASKKGILIKGTSYLEKLSKLKTIVFDKTGTLTEGSFEVTAVHPDKYNEEKLLHMAAHVERFSTHPIANSLKNAYQHEDDECEVTVIEEKAGRGIEAKINNDIVCVGNDKMMEEIGVAWKPCKHVGTIVHVAINNEYIGHVVVADKIKEDTKKAVDLFNKNKINMIMLTGDHQNVAESVSQKLGIKNYYADLLPEDKVKRLEEIIKNKKNKEQVAFIGDGINDAPVLARADVGIAMGGLGSDVAIEVADIVLMDDKLTKIIDAINISKRTSNIARENIFISVFIKIFVLILAGFGYAPMWLAIFADVGVTIIAILNSMRTLKNID